MSTVKRNRCKNGTRKNKKTGNCDSVMENTCAICLDRIVSGNVKTKCKHNFHKKCLIGWCKSQSHLSASACPICRSNIKDTCKKITPFDSQEAFRYTSIVSADAARKKYYIEQLTNIIHNPKFDVNVSNGTRSILHELCYNKYYSVNEFKNLIDYLLGKKDIIVSHDLISDLLASNNSNILTLVKKHKKVPKIFKSLV